MFNDPDMFTIFRMQARVEASLPLNMYSPLQHFVYCFYPPLYIAGPTITFNDFASQLAAPATLSKPEVSRNNFFVFGVRTPSNLPDTCVSRHRRKRRGCQGAPSVLKVQCPALPKCYFMSGAQSGKPLLKALEHSKLWAAEEGLLIQEQ